MQANPARTSATPPHLPNNQSFDPQGLETVNFGNGQSLSYDLSALDEQTRAFIEQQNRFPQHRPQPVTRENRATAHLPLGVGGQPGQSQFEQPPAHRGVVAHAGGPYYVDAQGRPIQANMGQYIQQGTQNGHFAQNLVQHLTPQQQQQQQQLVQQQFVQQHYAQQAQNAQHRALQPPNSLRPQPFQSLEALLPILLPFQKHVVSRAGSHSGSPVEPQYKFPSASASHLMQSASSVMPVSDSKPPARASSDPITSSVQPSLDPDKAISIKNETSEPTRSVRVVTKSPTSTVVSTRMAKQYRPRAKNLAVARVREKDDIANRLKMHIAQAQAQLETVMGEEEEQADIGQAELPSATAVQEKFNQLVLDYLRRAGFEHSVNALQSDVKRQSQGSSTHIDPHEAKPLSRESSQRSPHDSSSPGDRTLIGSTPDVSLVLKSPPNKSPSKVSSPVKKTSSGNSLSWTALDVEGAMSSPGSIFADQDREQDMHAVAQSGAALVADADLDMQLGSTSSYKMDLKVCSTEEEDHAINCDSTMATKARPVLNDPPLPLDLGYLYSWWKVFEDSHHFKRKLLRSRLRCSSPTHVSAMPSTAMQPTSAMATRIAISAPAAAVRASSIDAHGQRTAGLLSNDPSGQTGQKDAAVLYNQRRADPPETAVTARLQAADAMRRAQQAHIDAQQEEVKRRHQQTGSMGPSAGMAQPVQRQAVIMENGTQVYLTPEEIQRHMMRGQVYQHQTGLPVSQQSQSLAQFHGHVGTIPPNGSVRQYLPSQSQSHAMMAQPIASVDSQPADSTPSIKRQAEPSPGDAPGKKPKQAGKRPTPEDHQRQAIEMANRAAQHISVPPGMPQMPGQMHQLVRVPLQHDQGVPRNLSEAERQYAQSQVAYARQQVTNSPTHLMGISPMHANEPSAQGLAPSPSTYPSSFSLNGTPTSAKPRRSKQAHSLVLDTDTIADVMDVTPVSASSAKRKQVRKAPPKAGAGRGRGRGGKGGRSRDSIGSVTDKTPSAAGSLGFNVAASPSSTSEAFGGSGAAPEYLQSLPYQRPSSGLEPHLPDRYNEDQHSERPKQYNIIQNEYQSGGMQDRQNILGTRELDLLSQPNLEDQQDLNSRDQHADFHEPQVSTPPHDHMTESFLKALDEYGKEELATADPPVSAIQADFDETGFDFDWTMANFGGDETQD